MNYRFTYDEEFRQKYFMDLSDEEATLVRVIVSGGHDTILYGYKPERLVKAICVVVVKIYTKAMLVKHTAGFLSWKTLQTLGLLFCKW